jgi:hypothetical protein
MSVGCVTVNDATVNGTTVNVADFEEPYPLAVIVTAVDVETTEVEIAKLTLVVPAGMATVEGTLAADGALLANDTTAPPGGAAAPRVTVPVAFADPPVSDAWFTVTLATVTR